MRVVLLGDSHLARVRRDLPILGHDVVNRAVGGSVAADLLPQLAAAGCTASDALVVSIGSNDAGWRGVPLARFETDVAAFLDARPTGRLVYLAPADEPARGHAAAAIPLFGAAGAEVVDAHALLAGLGDGALEPDRLHLTGAAYAVVLPALRKALEAHDAPPPSG
jgi:lysophospholipase L1-like esterase